MTTKLLRHGIYHSGDGDFHFIDWGGTGSLAHFSHATGLCAEVYTPLADRLSPFLRVLGMDDRGHGKTRAPIPSGRLKDWDIFAQDLEGFFRHQKRPVIAIGHSRGAVASLLLSAKKPELIRALVLIDPTILPLSWMWWWYLAKKTGLSRFVPIAVKAAGRRELWPDKEAVFSAYSAKAPFLRWEDGFLEGYIEGGTEELPTGTVRLACNPAWEAQCFAACSHDVWRYVRRLRIPTLLLHGSDSDICLPSAIRRFKTSMPEATIIRFEGTSHFVPMERPDETAKYIRTFLRTHGLIESS